MNAQIVKDFAELVAAVRRSMDEYLLTGELHGVACAAGILSARLNNLNVIVSAYETRDPSDKDRFELSSLASSLDWLGKDDAIARDFAGITLRLPDTAFSDAHAVIGRAGDIDYRSAINMLHRAVVEIVLEGKPVPLSS